MKVLSFPGYETWGVRGREDQEILKHIDLKSDLLEQTVGEANNQKVIAKQKQSNEVNHKE